jgi:hypothetical protein
MIHLSSEIAMKHAASFVVFTGALSLATSLLFDHYGLSLDGTVVVVVGFWAVAFLAIASFWSRLKSKGTSEDTKGKEEKLKETKDA